MRSAAHPPPQLMDRRQTEAMGIIDDHDIGVFDIDPDFDDGSRNKKLQLAGGEAFHDFLFLFPAHAPVQKPDAVTLAQKRIHSLINIHDIAQRHFLVFFNGRTHHITLLAFIHQREHLFQDLLHAGRMDHPGFDRHAALRQLGDDGDIHVTE